MTNSTAVRAANLPYAGDTLYVIPADNPSTSNVPASMPNIPVGMTDRTRWQRRTNPREGIEELLWLESRPPELAAYQGRWVIIVGQHIVADGSDMRELRALMAERSIVTGLVARVPQDIDRAEYLIG